MDGVRITQKSIFKTGFLGPKDSYFRISRTWVLVLILNVAQFFMILSFDQDIFLNYKLYFSISYLNLYQSFHLDFLTTIVT